MSTFLELARHSALSLVIYLAARVANAVVFVIAGRFAGPSEAGILSLAFTYLLVFSVFTRGLDELATRQTARFPETSRRCLGTFFLLRGLSSVFLYLVMLAIVFLVIDYSEYTRQYIALMGLSMIPESLGAVGQAVLVGHRRFRSPTIATLLMSATRLAGGVPILILGKGPVLLATVWALGALLYMSVTFAAAWRLVGALGRRDWLNPAFLAQNLRLALPFLATSFLIAFEFQLDVILLSVFQDEVQVGLYSAATTITAAIVMLSQAYRMAVYPIMASYAAKDSNSLERLYQRSMRLLGTAILPMATGIAILSPQIMKLVFGQDFVLAAPALTILAWSLAFIYLDVPNTRMMYVRDRQKYTTLFLVGSMTTNITLNLLLDGPLGPEGAAIARLCSSFVFFSATYLYVSRILSQPSLARLLLRPGLAALGMGLIVWLLRDWPLFILIPIGAAAYAGQLLAIGGIPKADLVFLRESITAVRSRRLGSRNHS